jgi:hypothetical protein
MRVSRVLRVQLRDLTDVQWRELRELAGEAARFCNLILADQYAQAWGYAPPTESAFVRAKGRLSGDVRVALQREAWTAWRRHRARIMAGTQRLALFEADRALVCRGEHLHHGHRQRHAQIRFDGETYSLSLCLRAQTAGGRQEFALWWKPTVSEMVTAVLDQLASGGRLLKVTLRFERPGRKVFALLTYERVIPAMRPGELAATLGPLEPDGSLWLRMTIDGRAQTVNYTDRVSRLLSMKAHFAGLHARLKRRMRRSGPGWRQDYRRALVRAGSFSAWAHGFLQQWSAEVIATCRRQGVGHLSLGPIEHQDLPMAAWREMLTYKCQEAGMIVERFDPATPETARAVDRVVQKEGKRIAARRKALAVLRDAIGPSMGGAS